MIWITLTLLGIHFRRRRNTKYYHIRVIYFEDSTRKQLSVSKILFLYILFFFEILLKFKLKCIDSTAKTKTTCIFIIWKRNKTNIISYISTSVQPSIDSSKHRERRPYSRDSAGTARLSLPPRERGWAVPTLLIQRMHSTLQETGANEYLSM